MEDYEEEGHLTKALIIENIKTLELNLTKEDQEFIIYVLYQKSESLDKLKYQYFLDLIEGSYNPLGQGISSSNEGGARKRPESSSPEKLKARNKTKFEQI